MINLEGKKKKKSYNSNYLEIDLEFLERYLNVTRLKFPSFVEI